MLIRLVRMGEFMGKVHGGSRGTITVEPSSFTSAVVWIVSHATDPGISQ
jgi:hypothetical protein